MPKSAILTGIANKFRDLQMKRGFPVLILIVAAFNVTLIGGKRRTIGILVSALHSAFNTTTSMTQLNWIAESYTALAFFLVPFSTTFLLHHGRPYQRSMFAAGLLILLSCLMSATVPSPAYLFFTHTVLHGMGSTLVIATCALIIGDYFDRGHRFHVLATALISDGPLGVVLFGPLYAFLVEHCGWRNAFVFVGLIFMVSCWLGAFVFFPNKREEYSDLSTEEEGFVNIFPSEPTATDNKGWAFPSFSHIYENHQIILWLFERMVHYAVVFDLLMNLTDFVTDRMGNRLEQGSQINLAFGLGESAIFILGLIFGDRIQGYISFAYLVGSFFSLAFMFIIDFLFVDMNSLIILSGFLGFFIGSGNSCLYAASEEIMLVHGSIGFPVSIMMTGVGMLISPIFSGYIIDTLGYQAYFNCQTGLIALRFCLLIGINSMMWEHRKKNKELMKLREKHLLLTEVKQQSGTQETDLMTDRKPDTAVQFVE